MDISDVQQTAAMLAKLYQDQGRTLSTLAADGSVDDGWLVIIKDASDRLFELGEFTPQNLDRVLRAVLDIKQPV